MFRLRTVSNIKLHGYMRIIRCCQLVLAGQALVLGSAHCDVAAFLSRGRMIHTILEKKQFSKDVFYLRVAAPEIARQRKAGQFVIIQLDIDYGERIPLTIADADPFNNWYDSILTYRGNRCEEPRLRSYSTCKRGS